MPCMYSYRLVFYCGKHCQFKEDGSRLYFSAVLKFALGSAYMHVCEWVFLCLCVLVLLYLYFFPAQGCSGAFETEASCSS